MQMIKSRKSLIFLAVSLLLSSLISARLTGLTFADTTQLYAQNDNLGYDFQVLNSGDNSASLTGWRNFPISYTMSLAPSQQQSSPEWHPTPTTSPHLDYGDKLLGDASIQGLIDSGQGIGEGYLAFEPTKLLDLSQRHILKISFKYSYVPSNEPDVPKIGTNVGDLPLVNEYVFIQCEYSQNIWYMIKPTANTWQTVQVELYEPSMFYSSSAEWLESMHRSLKNVNLISVGFAPFLDNGRNERPVSSYLSPRPLMLHVDGIEAGFKLGEILTPEEQPYVPPSSNPPLDRENQDSNTDSTSGDTQLLPFVSVKFFLIIGIGIVFFLVAIVIVTARKRWG